MPPLNEGSLLFMPVLMPKTGLKEIQRVMSWQDKVIAETPEVATVAGKLGRFETATDPAPTEMIETTIMLKPEYIPNGRFRVKRNPEWREGMTMEKLKAELTEKLKQVPGYVPAFLQPIENRILMLYTGIRAQVGVKIYGDNLDTIQRKAFEIEKLINEHPRRGRRLRLARAGEAVSRTSRWTAQAMARYGLSAKDVLDAVEIAIGGKNVSTTIEGRERFPDPGPRRAQRARRHRETQPHPRRREARHGRRCRTARLAAAWADGAHPHARERRSHSRPLHPARHGREDHPRDRGRTRSPRENGRLRVYVQANVQDRDLGGFVEEVEQKLKTVDWEGMTYKMTGEYENQRRFVKTMQLVFPLVLMIIFVLLYIVYHSALEAAHVMLAVPFALTGGVFCKNCSATISTAPSGSATSRSSAPPCRPAW